MYLRTQTSKNSTLKIPNRNITLFLKEETKLTARADAAPVKKITLSIVPEISKENDELSDKIPLVIDEFLEEEAPTSVLAETSHIPLQNELAPAPKEKNEPEKLQEKIAGNFEKMINSPPPVDEKELMPTYEPQKAIVKTAMPAPQDAPPFIKEETKVKTIVAKEPEKPLELVAMEYQKPVVVQKNISTEAPKEALKTAEKSELLIPIEKNVGIIRTGNKKIEIINKAQTNQVALNAKNIPIKSMVSSGASDSDSIPPQNNDAWQSMDNKASNAQSETDAPWQVAIGSKHPRNKAILESDAYQKDEKEIQQLLSGKNQVASGQEEKPIELASETVKNILIPIPEDILKDDNLTPQLVSSNKNKQVEEELAAKEAKKEDERIQKENSAKDMGMQTAIPAQPTSGEKKGSILNSISSIFSGSKDNMPQIGVQAGSNEEQDSLLNAFKRKNTRTSGGKILPTEIRLSFQPNRAEISGQTLKWIRAFANKIIEEPSTGLEIRIDGTSSPLMQQRRLNLLQNILGGEGVDFNKVNTIFTSREPNSFIIRTVRLNNATKDMPEKSNTNRNNNHTQW